jgi:hypothetical protein
MLRVTIDLCPGGDTEKARPIGLILIANDGTGTKSMGNYNVALAHEGRHFGKKGTYKKGRVKGFYRQMSPYHLVLKALKACLEK